MSRIEDWGERAYIHVYRRGLESRLLDQLYSHPGTFDTLQELMDVTLELDTGYNERQKGKGGNQEKKPPATGSNKSSPPQNSSSKRPHQNKNKKGKQFESSKDKPHAALLNKENKLISSENERRIKKGLWDEEESPEEIETVFKVVPPAYHQYFDIFSKLKAEKLPLHCACDDHIKLEGLLPSICVIYALSNQDSVTIWAYISENVEKGFIRTSSSSIGAPGLFVKKKDGGLRLCVDYRKLNAVTRKNRYPVPPTNQLLTVFNGSTIFSKIDRRGAYSLLRIKEGDEHLTAVFLGIW
ncbi:hypothetical protein O181_013218 [Austropuccinia psidii MF-1]|uniref:Reverse transcriptase domain-containing protein n=1 Tax=Austropuccinia psidii MF-1 TaxID=1389203 RepID=A0A9Q3BYT5_9BASI|nr:hypothetical protein [Austropuccinia psidii MF-1]